MSLLLSEVVTHAAAARQLQGSHREIERPQPINSHGSGKNPGNHLVIF